MTDISNRSTNTAVNYNSDPYSAVDNNDLLKARLIKDKIAAKVMMLLTFGFLCVVILIGFGLYYRSRPLLADKSIIGLITSEGWKPFKHEFGFLPFIMGSFWITAVSVLIAVPLCVLAAVYLSEYAHVKIKQVVSPMIDILAGIPSVIYGVWGVIIVVPLVEKIIAPFFHSYSTGYSVLAGGIVLSIMIFPLLLNVIGEVFNTVPEELKNASVSLGATKWQTAKYVLIRKSLPGIIAAIVLAVSRAFGETIAVLMVCGNIPIIPKSVFDSAYPLSALIANNYGEMLSIRMYDSALLFAALILFVMIFFFNAVSRVILIKVEEKII
jgi:phosphate transport system permease protein